MYRPFFIVINGIFELQMYTHLSVQKIIIAYNQYTRYKYD